MAVDDALIQTLIARELWTIRPMQQRIFYNREPHSMSCAVICVISFTNMNRI